MSLYGSLHFLPLLDLFSHLQQQSGLLRLDSPQGCAVLWLERGVLMHGTLEAQSVPLDLLPWLCLEFARPTAGHFAFSPEAPLARVAPPGWSLSRLSLWLGRACAELDPALPLPDPQAVYVPLEPRETLDAPLRALWSAVWPGLVQGQTPAELGRSLPLGPLGLAHGLHRLEQAGAVQPLTPVLGTGLPWLREGPGLQG